MVEKRVYNTKSRNCILQYLNENADRTVSANDIIDYLKQKGIEVNFTTVYRFLNRLTNEQKVIKFTDKDSQKAVYQLAKSEKSCHEHIHIKCVGCGKLHHLDCNFMDELKTHLNTEHGFDLKCSGSVLYGLCKSCKK